MPRARKERDSESVPGPLSIQVLVAAYNEESVIGQTLESLVAAALELRARLGERLEFQVVVGLDHCTDATAARVAELASRSPFAITAVENEGERGKWHTLMMLAARSRSEWVAFVDSGSVWDARLLLAALPLLGDGQVMGIAPSYSPRGSGLLERANWKLERALKRLENAAGGPVSVHGASVLYRRSALLNAMSALQGTAWLNDDVVLPLTLRLQNPSSRIVYLADGAPSGWVSDVGLRSELAVEFRRRRRMVMGNLQWIRSILLPQAGILLIASRRVFRVFWAYWILLIVLGAGLEIALALQDVSGPTEIARALWLELALLAAGIAAAGGLLFSNWVRRVAMAFGSGLMVTRYWKELSAKRGVSWV
jgi:glycosyltransferase involved in cell wall biosynthesis